MKRQFIDHGEWFDIDASQRWDEHAAWDGTHRITCSTCRRWENESLYRTRMGVYVLNRWPAGETWRRIEPAEAAEWLIQNTHNAPEGDLADLICQKEV